MTVPRLLANAIPTGMVLSVGANANACTLAPKAVMMVHLVLAIAHAWLITLDMLVSCARLTIIATRVHLIVAISATDISLVLVRAVVGRRVSAIATHFILAEIVVGGVMDMASPTYMAIAFVILHGRAKNVQMDQIQLKKDFVLSVVGASV